MFVQQCFDEVERVYDDTPGREKKLSREDWAHGSLLITIELLRCSNVAAEVRAHLVSMLYQSVNLIFLTWPKQRNSCVKDHKRMTVSTAKK